ncbi:MAG TPA: alginate export family protein [Thermoanaerobaculia bacterium]
MKLRVIVPLAFLCSGAAFAASPEIKPIFDVRLRYEGFDTPARNTTADRSYHLGLGRARVGLDAKWTHWTLHGLVQAAGVVDVPENPAFGAGSNYLSANNGDTSPSQIGIAELNAQYANGGFRMTLGRQFFVDGFEVSTGVGHLDAMKRRLLADRLVGVADWTNVGRRFDGASFGYGKGSGHLAVFGLRPLAGTFDHEDAFDPLDDVEVYGLTVTGQHGAWIPGAEVRLFAVQYEDGRQVAQTQPGAAGDDLSITTAGASLLAGNASGHVLVWGALQTGEWGTADQEAWAFIVNAGRNFPSAPGKPMVHVSWEQSSGDDNPGGGDHETFFNVLPTNHKYYGIMDYVDFPNLRDLYVETLLSAGEKVKVRLALHDFALTERSDAWYGGSGAFEEESFGYAARVPASGRYPSDELGRELDAELTWTLPHSLTLGAGGGLFWGGEAAEAFMPVEADGSWLYLELTWKK